MVNVEQIEAMINFIEQSPVLALGPLSRTKEGRSTAKQLWNECAKVINTRNGPNKKPDEWRLFFNEYKSKLVRKIRAEKLEISEGRLKRFSLTPLQERLYEILVRNGGEIDMTIPENPLSQDPFSVFKKSEYETPSPPPATPPPQTSSTLPRKKATKRRQTNENDEDGTSSCSSRLDRLEGRYAAAMLEHARATARLAAAIDKIADSLARPHVVVIKTSKKSKKKRTCQLILSPETESGDTSSE